MTDDGFPAFELFYAAANQGRTPFPWQARLASVVTSKGWPSEIGVPTGLGKTTCIDIAVWALASQASRAPAERTLSTRIWYVVNRRLLVDAAYEHGRDLARMLAKPELVTWPGSTTEHITALKAVADGLRTIGGLGSAEDSPLVVTRLRGGAELGARPPHPAHPALIFATVPMFASTWLFRGYASSPGMRSVDAAHAGIDSLVLLDEAHLARPLRALAAPLMTCDVGDPVAIMAAPRARPVIVSVTATGDAEDPFVLDASDRDHPVVRQRLHAPKPVRLVGVNKKSKDLAPAMVAEFSQELARSDAPVAAVVFANTPRRAREVFDGLVKARAKRASPLNAARLVMLTGRMRRREADEVRRVVLDPVDGAPSDRDRSESRAAHLVVVATQTLEVGADLDFDLLVTESCGRRALIQRLGRLNRLGLADTARGVLVHPEKETDWGLYGTEPADVWDALLAAGTGDDPVVHLSPSSVSAIVGNPDDAPQRIPELLPAHLWEWAKTTTPPPGEAPVELFFEGFGTEGPRVSICWRATRFAPEERLIPGVTVDESVDLPLAEVREALTDRLGSSGVVTRLADDRATVEECRIDDIRPSDVLVLHTTDGLYDEHGWAPDSSSEVLDLSLARWPGMPIDLASIRHWAAPDPPLEELSVLAKQLTSENDDLDVDELASRLREALLSLPPRHEVADDWQSLVGSLTTTVEWSGAVPLLLRRRERRPRRESVLVAVDAFDDLSADSLSQGLEEHLATVGEIAGQLASAIGLPDELAAAVDAAGRLHDVGKADPRFQRWLDPRGEAEGELAKSSTPRTRWRVDREASGWPQGGRHELISARLVECWLRAHGNDVAWDADLVLHLVLAHHGQGRPLVAPADDKTFTTCTWSIDGHPVTVDGDLSITDWNQPARFRRCCERYGYWGLALLEALVRQADHMASSAAGGVA